MVRRTESAIDDGAAAQSKRGASNAIGAVGGNNDDSCPKVEHFAHSVVCEMLSFSEPDRGATARALAPPAAANSSVSASRIGSERERGHERVRIESAASVSRS